MPTLLICEVLVWSIGSPIAGAVLISSFSMMLGNRNKQGLSMGLIGSAGSLGRIFAPPLNSVLMHNELGYITFVFFAVMSLVGSFALWIFARVVDRENRDFSDGELKSLLEKDGDVEKKKKKDNDDPLKLALF
jgi:MFS family permease